MQKKQDKYAESTHTLSLSNLIDNSLAHSLRLEHARTLLALR